MFGPKGLFITMEGILESILPIRIYYHGRYTGRYTFHGDLLPWKVYWKVYFP
jgi:hypothetical protein